MKYIHETLDSLFAQDYPNIEIIIVNDGSKDGTLELLRSYGSKIVLVDQANTGVSGARNAGIRVAQGAFIGFCDADDLWAPRKVSEQIEYLCKHPTVGMVYCTWCVWEPSAEGVFVIPEWFDASYGGQEIDLTMSGWIYHKLLLGSVCLTSSVMFRKVVIDKVGYFDTRLSSGEDYAYWLRTSRITEIHKLKSSLVLYRILPQSLSRTVNNVHHEYDVVLDAIAKWGVLGPNGEFNPRSAMRARFAQMRFDFGYLHVKSGDTLLAIKAFRDAISQKPFWYLPWVYMIFSLCKWFAYKCQVYLRRSL